MNLCNLKLASFGRIKQPKGIDRKREPKYNLPVNKDVCWCGGEEPPQRKRPFFIAAPGLYQYVGSLTRPVTMDRENRGIFAAAG